MERGSLTSYAIYGSAGMAAAVNKGIRDVNTENTPIVSTVVEESAKEAINPRIARILEEAPWLFNNFPEMVADGSLNIKNGSILLYGVGLLDIFSFIVIPITLGFAIGKFIMDRKSFKLTQRRLAEGKRRADKCPDCGSDISNI